MLSAGIAKSRFIWGLLDYDYKCIHHVRTLSILYSTESADLFSSLVAGANRWLPHTATCSPLGLPRHTKS